MTRAAQRDSESWDERNLTRDLKTIGGYIFARTAKIVDQASRIMDLIC